MRRPTDSRGSSGPPSTEAEHRLSLDIAAPPERVFALWMDLDRMSEWVGGVTRVTDVTGPIDVAGTRSTVRA